jgi:hypothetical protein
MMREKRRRRGVAVVAVSALGLVLFGNGSFDKAARAENRDQAMSTEKVERGGAERTSHAVTGYEVVERTFVVPPRGFLRDVVSCPPGKVVLGGGAWLVTSLPPGVGSSTVLRESAPGQSGNPAIPNWVVALESFAPELRVWRISAVCSHPLPGYEVVRKEVVVRSTGFLRDTADCPAGKAVLGGGVKVDRAGSRNFGTFVSESSPGTVGANPRAVWGVAFLNMDKVLHTIGISAVCSDPLPGYEVLRRDFVVPAHGFLGFTSVCPAGKVVLGGGASVVREGSGNFHIVFRESGPRNTGGRNGLWRFSGENADHRTHTLGVFAVCSNRF